MTWWRSTYIPTGEFQEMETDDPKKVFESLATRLCAGMPDGAMLPLNDFKTERVDQPLTFGERALIDAYRRGDYATMRNIIDSKKR